MLPRTNRTTSRADWKRIHRRGTVVQSRDLVLKHMPNKLDRSRFGFVIGTKVSKRAVVRNRIKRQLRHYIQKHKKTIASGNDIIIIVRVSAVARTYKELSEQVHRLLSRAKLSL